METFPIFTDRQKECLEATRNHKYVLYGGAAGGGKSFFLRWWLVLFLISLSLKQKLKNVNVGLFCEDYPALRDRHISKLPLEFGSWLGTWNGSVHEFRLLPRWGSGAVCFRNLDDVAKYRSSEFAAVGVDELTRNKRVIFDILRSRLRWAGFDGCRFVGGTNPDGIGHLWCKRLWVDRDFRGEPPELKPSDFAYIPAKASDNKHLPESYVKETLASLPDAMRRALMDGSWDVIEGQYFTEWNADIHVVKPWPVIEGITDKWGIPLEWLRVGGIDWGRANPWAALEAAIDPDGRLIVYRGVAEAGWDHEQQAEWIRAGSPQTVWYADKACWAKSNANSKELRAQDMSHAELWAKYGARNIMPAVGGDRPASWGHVAAFLKLMPVPVPKNEKERLALEKDPPKKRAWVEFFDNAGLRGDHGIITTLPKLIRDPDRPEDVDTTGDDHSGDAFRYLTQSRPAPTARRVSKVPYQRGDWFADKHAERLGELIDVGDTMNAEARRQMARERTVARGKAKADGW